jgi:hypothetical protein
MVEGLVSCGYVYTLDVCVCHVHMTVFVFLTVHKITIYNNKIYLSIYPFIHQFVCISISNAFLYFFFLPSFFAASKTKIQAAICPTNLHTKSEYSTLNKTYKSPFRKGCKSDHNISLLEGQGVQLYYKYSAKYKKLNTGLNVGYEMPYKKFYDSSHNFAYQIEYKKPLLLISIIAYKSPY